MVEDGWRRIRASGCSCAGADFKVTPKASAMTFSSSSQPCHCDPLLQRRPTRRGTLPRFTDVHERTFSDPKRIAQHRPEKHHHGLAGVAEAINALSALAHEHH